MLSPLETNLENMLKITIFETETNQNIRDQLNNFWSIKSVLQYNVL